MTEFELIAKLKPLLPTNDLVVTGAGDDCAEKQDEENTAHLCQRQRSQRAAVEHVSQHVVN